MSWSGYKSTRWRHLRERILRRDGYKAAVEPHQPQRKAARRHARPSDRESDGFRQGVAAPGIPPTRKIHQRFRAVTGAGSFSDGEEEIAGGGKAGQAVSRKKTAGRCPENRSRARRRRRMRVACVNDAAGRTQARLCPNLTTRKVSRWAGRP